MDSFFGIGLFELVMIAVVALLVLGPERLPGAMREVAKWMRQLRNLSSEFQSQFSEEFKMLDEINPRRIINEVIDPNAPTTAASKPAPGQPAKPLAPKPVTPAAKSPAAKSPAAKPANSPAPTAAPAAVTTTAPADDEAQNTILPPAKAAVVAASAAAAAAAPTVEELAGTPPPAAPPAANLPAADESRPASSPANGGADAPAEASQ